ncbi:MAG: hypothetical protein ACLFO2_02340 [Candidatus Woesearchaeota archaeon]
MVGGEVGESRSALGTFLLVLGGLVLFGGVGAFFVLRQKGYFAGSLLGATEHVGDLVAVQGSVAGQSSREASDPVSENVPSEQPLQSPDQNLSWYVRQMRMLGFNDDAIRNRLENAGWSSEKVSAALMITRPSS